MARKGEFKQPVVPLRDAVERAMEIIDGYGCTVAIFMLAGQVTGTKKSSDAFERKTTLHANLLVGVYDQNADARQVREDLATFYA
ncbi:hypothetical protein [Noviherbaspirillum saxi]|nr:hypothetical protein [Noviherbaspirillum saxi]